MLEFELLVNAIDTHQCLPGAVDTRNIVVMPGDIATLIGCNRALDIGRGQPRDQGIEYVRYGCFQRVCLHVTRILLGAKPVTLEQVSQRDGIRQIEA